MFTKSKVQFQDQQLDDYLLENSVLKSKLQSKVDALAIMNKELDKCSMERDRYKMLVEQLQHKESSTLCLKNNNNDRYILTNDISGNKILASTRDHNCVLNLKIEALQNKLEEANGDIMALRKQLQKEPVVEKMVDNKTLSLSSSQKDYEQLVQILEAIQTKYRQLQLDYRATLDEKEELVADRDYYKSKVQRLNHHISYILANENKIVQDTGVNPAKSIVDIDALVMENKYLHERITQLQVEQEIVKRTLTKYKTLLDNRENVDQVKFTRGIADVMTQKQVREYLNMNTKTGLKRSSAAELKSLCLGLIEALNDKSIALQHQRKTNQILANRINELEKTLESWCSGQKCIPIFPSQMLLEEILPDTLSVKSDEAKENSLNSEIVDSNLKVKYSECIEDSSDINEHSQEIDCEYGKCDYEDGSGDSKKFTTKTVLPLELEELVKEALADLKPIQ